MRSPILSVLIVILPSSFAWSQSGQGPHGSTYTITALGSGVQTLTWTIKPGTYAIGNSTFIVGDQDVIVVDTGNSPAAGEAILEGLLDLAALKSRVKLVPPAGTVNEKANAAALDQLFRIPAIESAVKETVPLVAAQGSVAGTWNLKADAAEGQTSSGGTWSRSAVTGTLVIEQQDTALKGTWTGAKGEDWPFTGRVQGDRFEFTTEAREVPVVVDGQQTRIAFRWTFRGDIAGATLRGTMTFDRVGENSERHQPFSATRR